MLGDGAGWIKTQSELHFPRAIKVLNWGHVERTLHKAIRAALPGKGKRAERRVLHAHIPERLRYGDVEGALGDCVQARGPNRQQR